MKYYIAPINSNQKYEISQELVDKLTPFRDLIGIELIMETRPSGVTSDQVIDALNKTGENFEAGETYELEIQGTEGVSLEKTLRKDHGINGLGRHKDIQKLEKRCATLENYVQVLEKSLNNVVHELNVFLRKEGWVTIKTNFDASEDDYKRILGDAYNEDGPLTKGDK